MKTISNRAFCLVLSLVAILFINTISFAQTKEELINEFEKKLTTTTEWSQRKSILENLLDLNYSNVTSSIQLSEQLLAEAKEAKDYDCQIEIIRQLGNYMDNTEGVITYIEEVERLIKRNKEYKGTLAFLNNKLTIRSIYKMSNEEMRTHLSALLDKYKTLTTLDTYDQINLLLDLSSYISRSVADDSELNIMYLRELEKLVVNLPEENSFLLGVARTSLSILYTNSNMYKEGVESDLKTLEYVEHLKQQYQKKGRIYRDYSSQYYLIYRRLLTNYKALTQEQVEDYYNKILTISESSNSIKRDLENGGKLRIDFYYYMSKKMYKEALYCLNKLPETKNRAFTRYRYLEEKIFIYEQLGENGNDLTKIYAEYLTLLKNKYSDKDNNKLQELLLTYNIGELKYQNAQSELKSQQRIFIFGIVFIVILVAMALVLFRMYTTKKHLSKMLQADKDSLIATKEELVIAKNAAERSDRLKSAFLANVSHEIRTPLNSIIGFSELIIETESEEERRKYFEIVNQNNNTLLKLINDIIELSKLQSGIVESNIERIDINEFIEDTAKYLRTELKGNTSIEIITDMPQESLCMSLDKNQLFQITGNFANNAMKYTEKGFIKIGYSYQNNGLKIYVQDSGAGISLENQSKVFETFEQLNSFAQGSGIGLSICKTIMTSIGGKIGVESSEGTGSTFWAWFPATKNV